MRPGEKVILAALLCMMAVAGLRQISSKQRREVVGLGLLGIALLAATRALALRFPAAAQVVGDWLPCLLMLIVYWQAGRFFRAPRESLQAWLAGFDRRWLGPLLDSWSRRWSGTWIGTLFELAYLLCYPVIPAGVAVLYFVHQRSAIDEYWAVVLSASCLCYLCVALAQTLPPRLLEAGMSVEPERGVGAEVARGGGAEPAQGKIRRFNLWIVRRASIHLNTFPSAHVASAMAAALVVMQHAPGAGVVMLLLASSIAAGAVLGRYHYALDALFGAVLAFVAALAYRF